jgi:perosamine synthetase
MVATRRRNAGIFNAGLGEIAGIKPQATKLNAQHAWHQYCILVDEKDFGCGRDELGERLKARGVQNGVHYPRGLHQQPVCEAKFGKQTLALTEHLAESILAIPVHHGLSVDEASQVIDAIAAARTG